MPAQEKFWAELRALCGQAFAALLDATPASHPLALRVRIAGRSAAHGELFGRERHLREEILGQAAALGIARLWVEKVRVETSPLADAATTRARSDALADLQILLEDAPGDADLLKLLTEELRLLADKVPLELLHALPELQAIRDGELAGLVRAVTPGLLAHLASAD